MEFNLKLDNIFSLDRNTINLLKSHGLLEILIKKEIIIQQLKLIDLEEETILELKSNFVKQKKLEDENSFQEWLKKEEISEQHFINEISRPLKLSKLCNENFSLKAEARFLERKNDLDQVTYSLIRTSDAFLARELRYRIVAGEATFEDLAKKYTEGDERNSNGIVGPVGINQGHPALAEHLRKENIGVVVGPLALNGVYLLIRVESRQEAKLDSQMVQNMSKELFDDWLDEQSNKVMKELENLNKQTNNVLQEK